MRERAGVRVASNSRIVREGLVLPSVIEPARSTYANLRVQPRASSVNYSNESFDMTHIRRRRGGGMMAQLTHLRMAFQLKIRRPVVP